MSRQSTDYGWIGWLFAGIILVIFLFSSTSDNENKNSETTAPESTSKYSQPASKDISDDPPARPINSWHCVDATSYNQNAYDDNKCTNGSQTKYVSDSQAESLDPDYSPGKSGASYYNNQ